MNSRVLFSAKAGVQAVRDLPLPGDPEGRALKHSTPRPYLDELLREEMQ